MPSSRLSLLAPTIALAGLLLVVAPLPAADTGDVPSLYDRLGGLAPISVVVSDFIDVLVPDEVLNANPAIDAARQRVPAAYLKFHVTSMVCQATGGPCTYTGRGMQESHAHLNITEAEWARMEELFLQVLAKHSVPQAEVDELVAIVRSTKPAIVAGGGEAY